MTIQLCLTYVSLTPCADSCLEQPLHAILEQNIKMLIKGVLNQGQSPQRTPLLYAHMHTTQATYVHANANQGCTEPGAEPPAVAYPGFNKVGCLMICAQSARAKLEATPTFVDHTHHFRPLFGVHYYESPMLFTLHRSKTMKAIQVSSY